MKPNLSVVPIRNNPMKVTFQNLKDSASWLDGSFVGIHQYGGNLYIASTDNAITIHESKENKYVETRELDFNLQKMVGFAHLLVLAGTKENSNLPGSTFPALAVYNLKTKEMQGLRFDDKVIDIKKCGDLLIVLFETIIDDQAHVVIGTYSVSEKYGLDQGWFHLFDDFICHTHHFTEDGRLILTSEDGEVVVMTCQSETI